MMEVPRSRDDLISDARDAVQCKDYDRARAVIDQLGSLDKQEELENALEARDYEKARQVIDSIESPDRSVRG